MQCSSVEYCNQNICLCMQLCSGTLLLATKTGTFDGLHKERIFNLLCDLRENEDVCLLLII